MKSLINTGRVSLGRLVASWAILASLLGAGMAESGEAPTTPENFTPVIRFAVCSDTHVGNDDTVDEGQVDTNATQRLEKLITFMNGYSAEQDYKGFDALCVVGDLTNRGRANQYDRFLKVVGDNLQPETVLMTCTGNHEYFLTRDDDPSVSTRLYEEKMQRELNTVYEIKGYSFILCSYDGDSGTSYVDSAKWLKKAIGEAEDASRDKPVFVFQHAAPFNTVYGSIAWGDPSITSVLSGHESVIDFSGHSHYPINDPRSIWQGSFTALGCGSMSICEASLDGVSDQRPYEYDNAAQFYIVEADAEGNVRIRAYDLITDSFFDVEYYLTGLGEGRRDYSYQQLLERDSSPIFPEDAWVRAEKNAGGETVLSFLGAEDRYVVESYKVSISMGGVTVYSTSFCGKYMYLYEPNQYELTVGKLMKGRYHAEITAVNACGKLSSPLEYDFTVR